MGLAGYSGLPHRLSALRRNRCSYGAPHSCVTLMDFIRWACPLEGSASLELQLAFSRLV